MQPASQPAQSEQKPSPTTSAPRPNPDANGIYDLRDGVTAPKPIYTVQPGFNKKAREQKMVCDSVVQLIVEMDGHVRDAHTAKSCAENYITDKQEREAALEFDQKAIKAVSRYRFEPGLFQGKPVPVRLYVAVNFKTF